MSERPNHLANGRWIEDFGKLSDAEKLLINCCRVGEAWLPTEWDDQDPVRPIKATIDNCIRAELIRFLALGGDAMHAVHELGVMVTGAWITGKLDLSHCRMPYRLRFNYCYFESKIKIEAAEVAQLNLNGSLVHGIDADGMRVIGSMFLREEFCSVGSVRLLGAKIGGNLECDGGKFESSGGSALHADRVKIVGSLFLRNGFLARGEVRLLGAEIGGNLDCSSGTFCNANNVSIAADGIRVTESLFLSGVKADGAILLSAAKIGELIDTSACWNSGGHVFDGLHYDRIIGPLDAATRKGWLKSQRADQLDARDWSPQPWEQLIKVLREMGHPGTAAEIAIEKQRMMRKAGHIGPRRPDRSLKMGLTYWLDRSLTWLANFPSRTLHRLYGLLAGYGYRPTRIVLWMLALWLGCTLAFTAGRDAGYLGPSSPVINASSTFAGCGAPGETNVDGSQKAYWHSPSCPMPAEYTTLSPALYSLDLILPLVDLQQDADWAPIVVNENGDQLVWGQGLRALMWFEILFGWLASLMFVAIVSRLVDKD